MRISVNLEDDVVALINQEKLRTGESMKQLVDRAFRDGFAQLDSTRQPQPRRSKREQE
jgi:hypothetical protein